MNVEFTDGYLFELSMKLNSDLVIGSWFRLFVGLNISVSNGSDFLLVQHVMLRTLTNSAFSHSEVVKQLLMYF